MSCIIFLACVIFLTHIYLYLAIQIYVYYCLMIFPRINSVVSTNKLESIKILKFQRE